MKNHKYPTVNKNLLEDTIFAMLNYFFTFLIDAWQRISRRLAIPISLSAILKIYCQALIFFVLAIGCHFAATAQKDTSTIQTAILKNRSSGRQPATYNIITLANGTYGYDIYLADKKYIHQQTIPGLPGNKGFSTKQDAAKVASLVIRKIAEGKMPPSVSAGELKKLKIIL